MTARKKATKKKATKKAAGKRTPGRKKIAPKAKSAASAKGGGSLDATYLALRAVLAPFGKKLRVGKDDDTWLEVFTTKEHQGKPVWFAAIRKGKGYVSYYLMPMYVTPHVVSGMSPALAKRRKGNSCFNFTAPDPALFAELRTLTTRGLESFRAQGLA